MWSPELSLGVCRAPLGCGEWGDLTEGMGCFSDPQCSSLLHPMGLVMLWAGLRAGMLLVSQAGCRHGAGLLCFPCPRAAAFLVCLLGSRVEDAQSSTWGYVTEC